MLYTITALINTSEDNFFGYTPEDTLTTAPNLHFEVEATSWEGAAEEAFTIGNRMARDVNGRCWPSDVRSLSVGDVVKVMPTGAHPIIRYAACKSVGWVQVEEPPHMDNPPVLRDSDGTTYAVGDTGEIELAWSEVCMHLRVAGKRMAFRVMTPDTVQLLDKIGARFSSPILASEAGLWRHT